MKRILHRIPGVLAMIGLLVTSTAASTGCFCFMHQPELPDGAKELRRSK